MKHNVYRNNLMNIVTTNKIVCALLCRTSFKYFIQIFHFYLFRQNFIFRPFHLDIIKNLEDIVFGKNEKRNLLINMPPRMGKSQIMQYFVAWSYTINKQCNFILTSYGDDLVLKFSDFVKSIISSDLYKDMFDLDIDAKSRAKAFWKVSEGGELRATSMGGTITGFGAGTMQDGWGGAMIIDDPLKANDYKSETALKNCEDFYVNTLKSRLNNPSTPIILIMQRLHVDDLTGYVLNNEEEEWKHVKYQGLDEENEEALWPDKVPVDKLLYWKKTLPFFYYSQYQQEPIILGGAVIKREWFKFYSSTENYIYNRIFIAGDTAMKIKEYNDYSVFGVFGVTNLGKLHILDLIRGKWESPTLRQQLISLWNKWVNQIPECPCSAVYVEDKSSGTGLIQDLQAMTGIPILGLKADKDKLIRAELALPYIESGNVLLPDNESYAFNPTILSECEAFTRDDSHKHDDVVDVISYGIQEGLSKLIISGFDVV